MKTIPSPLMGRFWAAVLFLLATASPALGQDPDFRATVGANANEYVFTLTLPPLLPLVGSLHRPMWGLFIHYGDGNFEEVDVADNTLEGETPGTLAFAPHAFTHRYREAGTYKPTLSLTKKYSPPTPPRREIFTPPADITITTPDPPYIMDGHMLRGRWLTADTNHQVEYQARSSTTFALAWTRQQNAAEGTVAIFYGGLRDRNTGKLERANPTNQTAGSIMSLQLESSPRLVQAQAGTTAGPVVPGGIYSTMAAFYDSMVIIPNLQPHPVLGEGRDFLTFQNNRDLHVPPGKNVSILALLLTKQDLHSVNVLSKLGDPNFKKLLELGFKQSGPDGGLRISPDGGYVHDFYFYEAQAVYIHDPNELLITKLTPAGPVVETEFDFTSCSHYKSTNAVGTAIACFDHTELQGGSLEITGASQPGRTLTLTEVPTGTIVPGGTFYSKQIHGLKLLPGGCFTIHLKGKLPAGKMPLANEDGKILHGCVVLDGESDPNMGDICCANLKFDAKKPIIIDPPGPCDLPGFWNKVKCLCRNSPIPCWVWAIIALVLALWYFFKKKN